MKKFFCERDMPTLGSLFCALYHFPGLRPSASGADTYFVWHTTHRGDWNWTMQFCSSWYFTQTPPFSGTSVVRQAKNQVRYVVLDHNMSLSFAKDSLFSFHWSIFLYGIKWGNKNPLHFFKCRQTIVRIRSGTRDQQTGQPHSKCVWSVLVYQKNYQKNGGPAADQKMMCVVLLCCFHSFAFSVPAAGSNVIEGSFSSGAFTKCENRLRISGFFYRFFPFAFIIDLPAIAFQLPAVRQCLNYRLLPHFFR